MCELDTVQEISLHLKRVATLHTHTHPFSGPSSGTTRVSRYQKGKTNLDFTEARDSEWQYHQQGHMQVCTSVQTDNHTSTPPLSFLQAVCPSCCPTDSFNALKALYWCCYTNLVVYIFPPSMTRSSQGPSFVPSFLCICVSVCVF